MEAMTLNWSDDVSTPLIEHYVFEDPAANALVVGTGHFRSGQRMPVEGCSTYGMREISVIIEGAIETTVGGDTVILRAGDIVTIPENSRQFSHFLEDTRLVYLFFGHRAEAGEPS